MWKALDAAGSGKKKASLPKSGKKRQAVMS
jgi:hypothetical protein